MSIETTQLEKFELGNIRELPKQSALNWMVKHMGIWACNWDSDAWQVDFTTEGFEPDSLQLLAESDQRVA